jgi:hypothetical protein
MVVAINSITLEIAMYYGIMWLQCIPVLALSANGCHVHP